MRKSTILMLVLFLAMAVSGCGRVKPGTEGFLVNNWGDGKGEIRELNVGLHWFNPIKHDLYVYPMQLQNVSWETKDQDSGAFSWNDSDGMTFMADVGLSYRVKPSAASDIFIRYRKGLKEVTEIDMKNRLQDAFINAGSKRKASSIYGEGKMDFLQDIKDMFQAEFAEFFIIEKISFKSEMLLPNKVRDGIEDQITATQIAQRRHNEIAEAIAERSKQKEAADAIAYGITSRADADAYAIEVVQRQLKQSPEYVEFLKASRWDGVLPKYTNGVPMIKLAEQ